MAVFATHRWPARLLATLIAASGCRGGDSTGSACTKGPAEKGKLSTYTCRLGHATASPLAGAGYTWIASEQLSAPIAMLAGGTLVGEGPNATVGPIEILGPGVTIRNVQVAGGITISKSAARTTVTGVTVTPDAANRCVGVTAYSHAKTPETISVDGLKVTGTTLGKNCTVRTSAVAALAHVSGDATIECGGSKGVVIIQQPADATRSILTPGCTRVDLGAMLGVYGVRYETQFNHFDYIPHASGWSHWVATLAVLNVVIAMMLAMCGWTRWREKERQERAKKLE